MNFGFSLIPKRRNKSLTSLGLTSISLPIFAISGCSSTIKSTLDSDFTKVKQGVVYALPMQMADLRLTTKAVDQEKLEEAVDKAKKALKAATSDKTKIVNERKRLENELKNLAEQDGAEAAKTDLNKNIATYSAKEKIANKKEKDAKAAVTIAEVKLKQAKASQNGCIYTFSLKLLPPVADPQFNFVAEDFHVWTRDDETTLKVNASGLLESVDSKSTDKLPSMLVELQEPVEDEKDDEIGGAPEAKKAGCGERRPIAKIVDLARDDMPTFNMSDGAMLRVKNVVFSSASDNSSSADAHVLENITTIKGGGLFYRSPAPRAFEVEYCDPVPFSGGSSENSATLTETRACSSIDAWQVSLPQAGPVGFLPMNSAVFVSSENNAQFENGMLRSIERVRPSEVEQALKLPLKAVEAITGSLVDPIISPLTEWIPTPEASVTEATD